jgi:hypothetical protein
MEDKHAIESLGKLHRVDLFKVRDNVAGRFTPWLALDAKSSFWAAYQGSGGKY